MGVFDDFDSTFRINPARSHALNKAIQDKAVPDPKGRTSRHGCHCCGRVLPLSTDVISACALPLSVDNCV